MCEENSNGNTHSIAFEYTKFRIPHVPRKYNVLCHGNTYSIAVEYRNSGSWRIPEDLVTLPKTKGIPRSWWFPKTMGSSQDLEENSPGPTPSPWEIHRDYEILHNLGIHEANETIDID